MKDAKGHGSDARGAVAGMHSPANVLGEKDSTYHGTERSVVDRVTLRGDEAYKTSVRLASMAGQPRPNFVEWGKVYKTPEGSFRIVAGFKDTGHGRYEDESGRSRKLAGGKTFHNLTATLERLG